ncbi:MAG: molybdopterin-guanine dinucleotide biosynthesis protein B [Nitrosomonadales bacterium]|jgi:molybdopterin-guanine dinucleotide biosynthesis protein MobB|nr:molybdopterin-guanine dinucleotide biosynthesis protein B [Nitrosomonadales bacterium]MBT5573524.1 molybdopterin-guanine dinucleotide biosynthesis protein B [Nitrosomonadales bacterium]MBT6015448.1 molybdopterin-guanine dinucleotide biosynthesis protein B [Nitrosomonadales bacterium]MBT6250539.1 molybdopterin-guanine dinucleotide biosynthesis protein B [Nitrosomonadales bacterium]MBT6817889.1 molybdopterin-guanine dinucleotide biosynthesis protein B [Nitrosomonadales bacterium]
MNKKPFILGVCAANSGSGKTFVIERLIPALNKKGLSVSVIKHAHHSFDIDIPGKDSFKIREAGAKQTLIFNSARSALITENEKNNFNLDNAIEQINQPTDIILIEGLKTMKIPKIEIYREQISNKRLYKEDPNIIGVISDIDIKHEIPSFSFIDFDKISEFIIKLIRK